MEIIPTCFCRFLCSLGFVEAVLDICIVIVIVQSDMFCTVLLLSKDDKICNQTPTLCPALPSLFYSASSFLPSSYFADIFQLSVHPAVSGWLCQCCPPSAFLSASSLSPSVSLSVSQPLCYLPLPLSMPCSSVLYSFHLSSIFVTSGSPLLNIFPTLNISSFFKKSLLPNIFRLLSFFLFSRALRLSSLYCHMMDSFASWCLLIQSFIYFFLFLCLLITYTQKRHLNFTQTHLLCV